MMKLDDFFADLVAPNKRGRPRKGAEAMSSTERSIARRSGQKKIRLEQIAVLDTETDPFDRDSKRQVFPFTACLYTEAYGAQIIWDENRKRFIQKLITLIESLPGNYTIYAHNGGKFDWMFLIHQLRGTVKFKGRAIMSAKIGNHEIRDSLHIIPEKLAAWKKDHFDYKKLEKANRNKFRLEIIEYMTNDCLYLYSIVKSFLGEFGFKISVGAAAASELKKTVKVANISEATDTFLRRFFFGGRVECLAGIGVFESRLRKTGYKLFDVNSMYPNVMAKYRHPIGSDYILRKGLPGPDTVFIDMLATNHGALIRRDENGETGPEYKSGRFLTTIWEYETARKYNLIENISIQWCIDCKERSDFSSFIIPMYDKRQLVKGQLADMKKANPNCENTTEWEEAKKSDLFLKYLMNNAYGKFAQNPRRFKEAYITGPNEKPADDGNGDWGTLPVFECDNYEIWERPSPGKMRFYNVGTAASITGAARAELLEAIQNADDPIYCDTDSIICRDLRNVTISKTELGAWDIEQELDEVIIAGKKLYGCKVKGFADGHEKRIKVRSKGAGLVDRPDPWGDLLAMLDGQIVDVLSKAPTLEKSGKQNYLLRRLRVTAPRRPAAIRQRLRIKAYA